MNIKDIVMPISELCTYYYLRLYNEKFDDKKFTFLVQKFIIQFAHKYYSGYSDTDKIESISIFEDGMKETIYIGYDKIITPNDIIVISNDIKFIIDAHIDEIRSTRLRDKMCVISIDLCPFDRFVITNKFIRDILRFYNLDL